MHELTGRTHWHEPTGDQPRRLRRVRPAEDALRPVHGIGRHSDLPRHRREQGAEPSAGALEAHWAARAPTSSSTAPRASGAATSSRCRAPARSIAEKHLYEEIYLRRRGPRHHRGLARQATARRHVFEWQKGSLFSIPVNAWHRIVNASSAPALLLGRHHGAEPDEPDQQHRRDVQLPLSSSATASAAPTISTSTRTTSSPIRCAASPCGAPISSPTSSIATCRSTTGARPAGGASSRS